MADVAKIVKGIIAQQFEMPVQEVTTNTGLENFRTIDNLGRSHMLATLQERFDIYITDEDMDEFATTQDIIDYVETKLWWYAI